MVWWNNWYYYVLAFLISVSLIPLIKKISIKLNLYAKTNERTVHEGKISRIGGISFYLAFILILFFVIDPTIQMMGIVAGATLMFVTGLVDDIVDLKPKQKLVMQILASLILIQTGTCVGVIRLPFGIVIDFGIASILFTIAWVVGITNAMNLMDGLDGLAGGMASIILATIAFTALIEGKLDIFNLCLVLILAVAGFLIYNFHPASIFMGDCGSLFLGFIISAISLMGFKSSTVMTLALPILMMLIPIMDVISAIIRRTLKHKKFSEADKQHLHHQLMQRFGHGKTALMMWGMTAIFGFSAFIYLVDKEMGIVMMFLTIFVLELIIEKTGMISEKYHPILSILKNFVPKCFLKKQ